MTERRNVVKSHIGLVVAQSCFGIGGVVAAVGLPRMNPLLFAAIREVIAGPLLLLFVWWQGNLKLRINKSVCWRFLVLGACIFGNQAFFTLGLKLSKGPVAGSIWQPTQPLMTAVLAALCTGESLPYIRIVGLLLAFLGCLGMVLFSISNDQDEIDNGHTSSTQETSQRYIMVLLANTCFFINCLATSSFVVFAKQAVRLYDSTLVAASSYCIAAIYMLLFATILNAVAPTLVCPDCEDQGNWYIPKAAIPALLYWIIFQSCLAYALISWASKHAPAAVVSAYSSLQPIVAAIVTLLIRPYFNDLQAPGLSELTGAIFVFSGLYLVVADDFYASPPKRSTPHLSSHKDSGSTSMLLAERQSQGDNTSSSLLPD